MFGQAMKFYFFCICLLLSNQLQAQEGDKYLACSFESFTLQQFEDLQPIMIMLGIEPKRKFKVTFNPKTKNAKVANEKCMVAMDSTQKLGISCDRGGNFGFDRSTGEVFWLPGNAPIPVAKGYCELSSQRKF
jgi:hypothetical protein